MARVTRMAGVVLLGLMMLVGPARADTGTPLAGTNVATPSPTPSTPRPSPSPTATSAWDGLAKIPPELCKVPSPIILLQCNAPTIGKAGEKAGQVLRDAATEALEQGVIKPLANLVLEAIKSLVGVFVAMFLSFTSFDLRNQGALTLYGLTIAVGWLIGAVLLMSQMLRTMVQGRPVPLLQAFSGLLITALVGGAGVGLTALLMEGANILTKVIFDQMSTDGLPANQQSIHQQILTMMSLGNTPGGAAAAGVQVYVNWQLGVLVILVLIIQIIVVLLRNASLPLLALLLPVAAAGMIGGGPTRQWLPKIIAAEAAIIVYQPCVALIITAAVRQWSAARDAHGLVYGLVMLVLSLVAMPALLKVFAPLGALAGGGGGHGGGLTRTLTDLAMMSGRFGGGQAAGGGGTADNGEGIQPTSAGQFAQQREADNAPPADPTPTPPADRPTPPVADTPGSDVPPSGTPAMTTPSGERPTTTTPTETAPGDTTPADTTQPVPATATTNTAETSATTPTVEGFGAATTATTGAGPIGAVVHATEHGLEVAERHVGAGGEAGAAHPVDQHPAPPSDAGEGGLHDRT
ncbi:hypothetical protein ABZ897_55250 [Nonomuraea sp. NPDC046802]|uniref:hypothetical protein n=1 Tax=Nonomuraea sp. NPDC046802 TaxID=3154919 RepID=UPI0033DCBA44